jgi:uncharacterized SAM-binding protein YcdF (DUF218 family)
LHVENVFFVLSKVLAPLLTPENWVLLLGIIALFLLVFRRIRAATGMLAVATVTYVTIAATPLGTLLLNVLERGYPPGPAVTQPAGIVVLGGGEDASRSIRVGQPTPNDVDDRLHAGLVLARKFPDTMVLYTSGIGRLDQSGTPGADIAALLLTEAGLSGERLILERRSRNTAENAKFSLWLRPHVEGPWIIVTSAFHMRRSVATFCAAGWRDLVPWPTDFRGSELDDGIEWNFSEHARDLEISIREIVGLTAYRMMGQAITPLPEGCLHTE